MMQGDSPNDAAAAAQVRDACALEVEPITNCAHLLLDRVRSLRVQRVQGRAARAL